MMNRPFWIVQLIGVMERTHICPRHAAPSAAFSRRAIMEQHKLGLTGPNVSSLGLGCMAMSDAYGPADRGESIATIHAALDAGITLIDTGISTRWATMKC